MEESKGENSHEHSHEHNSNHANHSRKNKSVVKQIRGNPWIISTVVLGILVLIVLISGSSCTTGKTISSTQAESAFLNYLDGVGADLNDIEVTNVQKENGLYAISFNYQGTEYPYSYYVSLDGSLVGSMYAVSEEGSSSSSSSASTEVPQSDKPVVELFVMSYCPYGTQAEKGIIPAIEALGDSVDFRIRYVYYSMHGEKEITENLREYCVQENEPEKFLDYMNCFLEGDGEVSSSGYVTEGNDVNTCLAQAGIDTSELSTCMAEADEEFSVTANYENEDSWLSGYYPLFDVDKDLNEEYGVGGSPTLVINGVTVSSARDSQSYLDVICSAFTDGNAPSACDATLSSTAPSVYFGWDGTSSTSSENICG